jgi:hypothetical protein
VPVVYIICTIHGLIKYVDDLVSIYKSPSECPLRVSDYRSTLFSGQIPQHLIDNMTEGATLKELKSVDRTHLVPV